MIFFNSLVMSIVGVNVINIILRVNVVRIVK